MTPLILLLLIAESAVCYYEGRAPGSGCTNTDTGLLIAGGWNGDAVTSVELWVPPPLQYNCSLPSLPYEMYGHTLNTVGDRMVVCGFLACLQLTQAGWSTLQYTQEYRHYHASMVVGEGILLMGGEVSPTTTETVPVDGGESVPSFSLQPGRWHHCGIKVSDSTVILTGGWDNGTEFLVTEYSGLGEGEVTSRELPSLLNGRYWHTCGVYEDTGRKMLIVTGGHFYGNYLRSTEVYDYSLGTGGTWREVSPLPSPRESLRGSSVSGIFHVTGGYFFDGGHYMDQILAWDPVTESWAEVGTMETARDTHAVTEVNLASVTQFCTAAP